MSVSLSRSLDEIEEEARETQDKACPDLSDRSSRSETELKIQRIRGRIGEIIVRELLKQRDDITIVESDDLIDFEVEVEDKDESVEVEVKGRLIDKYNRKNWSDRRGMWVRYVGASRNQESYTPKSDIYARVLYSIKEGWIEVNWCHSSTVENTEWWTSPLEADSQSVDSDSPLKLVSADDLTTLDNALDKLD